MAYLCSGCGKFCSTEPVDPEVDVREVESGGQVVYDMIVTLRSLCCGEDVAQASVSGGTKRTIEHNEIEPEEIVAETSGDTEPVETTESESCVGDFEAEVGDVEVSVNEVKRVKIYTLVFDLTVKCDICGKSETFDVTDTIKGSDFEAI